MGFKIHFPDLNRSVEAEEKETILDSSLNAGIDLEYSCRFGRCGACKILLLSGEVEHLSHGKFSLTEEEKKEGYILACRSVPLSDLILPWIKKKV
ncbi:2Fe-2S iron-sulfur cluster binding domain-containing protein [Leptospira sp. 201903070]|uniref:2Fe-2S iron-sulfur cluster binding domain-containing protein n=1 Tax=Leptospira ainlahdjerensis TaxID=2810033 RepID=A0ABS2UD49_9LEPT|nr:2Fe-2S iron-sulfur cluster-binding protein [Leptospira ainlahdjerensis]MBM9578302.1 2Fe-2S iron-sulfur cluster binding domain-containing protein [Leptospira ainlahdjerensis]